MNAKTHTGNVDSAELKRFAAVAEDWWSVDGKMATLHHINPVRLDYLRLRGGGFNGKRILDVGCGGGLLAEALHDEGATVTGLDMTPELINIAKVHAGAKNIHYVLQAIEVFAAEFTGPKFDVITCLEMLEHVPDPSSIIRASAALLADDGDIFFSTINRNAKSFALAIVGAEYLLNIVPRGTHEYEKFIRPSELHSAVVAAGLETKDIAGLRYNPLSKTASISTDVDVNYFLHARFPK